VTTTIAAKSTGAEWARRRANRVASSKKSETRNWLTMIIMRSKSAMASRQRFMKAQGPQTDHQTCADERYAGAVDPQPGCAAESHSRISQNEDSNRCGRPE
jgi:hypothetical protein